MNLKALEYMPLVELEEMINQLQKDLNKLILFVDDQEEELTLQCQTVDELLAKLQSVNESERRSIEAELAEEQERKGMLDETLVGQRRNLKERQDVLAQYVKVLQRRRGMFDTQEESSKINLEPLVVQLIEQLKDTLDEKQRQTIEIEHLQTNLQQLNEMVDHQWSELEQKTQSIKHQQQQFQQANFELIKLQSQVQIEQDILQPIQDQLSATRQHLESLSHWIH